MQPAAGIVFALDGVLIGAGDVAFMRTITVIAAVGAFAPLNLAALHLRVGHRWCLGRPDRVHCGPARRHGAADPRWSLAGVGRAAVTTSGLIVVDKPAGWTSHDVVARLRRLAHTRRVGHAGTLDPMATGVLVVGVEKATRLLRYLALADKGYTATIRLGQATTTDDAEGELIASAPASAVTTERLAAATADAHRRTRAGAIGGVGDQDHGEAVVRPGPGRRGRGARRPAGAGVAVRADRDPPGRGRPARRRRNRRVLVGHVCPSVGPGPGRPARRGRSPYRAAPDPRRTIPDSAGRHPATSSPSGPTR